MRSVLWAGVFAVLIGFTALVALRTRNAAVHSGGDSAPAPAPAPAPASASAGELHRRARPPADALVDASGRARLRVDLYAPAEAAGVRADARIDVLCDHVHWIEGPTALRDRKPLRVLFSDVRGNTIHEYDERSAGGYAADDGACPVFKSSSGCAGRACDTLIEPGSNGLLYVGGANQGVLVMEHGRRRVSRFSLREPSKDRPVASFYHGRRLNSPNDGVCTADGVLLFTDPPFGLQHSDRPADEQIERSAARELDFSGVFALQHGCADVSPSASAPLSVVTRALPRPNGIALHPSDAHRVFVSNSWDSPADASAYVVELALDKTSRRVAGDRLIANFTERARTGADADAYRGPGTLDGLAFDDDGRLYVAGPGGVYVFRVPETAPTETRANHADPRADVYRAAPGERGAGELLAVIRTGVPTGNVIVVQDALVIAANHQLLRVDAPGLRPAEAPAMRSP